jgi:hypothetical protein
VGHATLMLVVPRLSSMRTSVRGGSIGAAIGSDTNCAATRSAWVRARAPRQLDASGAPGLRSTRARARHAPPTCQAPRTRQGLCPSTRCMRATHHLLGSSHGVHLLGWWTPSLPSGPMRSR